MKFHHKLNSWITDYKYMVKGSINSLIHRNPPKHYLGHVVPDKIPIILLPGILGTWSFMKNLGDKISLRGHPVYVVKKLGYNLSDIPDSSMKLKELISYISYENKIDNIILVAHSKGGLIGKYFLVHHNDKNIVKGMISIATPFSGSAMARLVPHASFRELLPDSKIIKDLNYKSEVNNQIVSIIPEYDNHVWSENKSFLEGAKNIEVLIHGHHKVIFDKNVQKIVIDELDKISK